MRTLVAATLGLLLCALSAPSLAQTIASRPRLGLDDAVDVVRLEEGERTLVAGVMGLDADRPTLRLVTLDDGRVRARAELLLTAIHPHSPPAIEEAASDVSVGLRRMTPELLRVSVFFGDGEDFRTVRELVLLCRLDAAGRWTALHIGWGATSSNERGECTAQTDARFAVRGRRVLVRTRTERSFRGVADFDSIAPRRQRRRECLSSVRPGTRRRSHRLRARPLPAPRPSESDWLEAFEGAPAAAP